MILALYLALNLLHFFILPLQVVVKPLSMDDSEIGLFQ
jgi:hypothetical protein